MALLPFVALAAIPILLHLLTLHRLKTVELSTFRFLFDSYVQQRRRMRFLEALLAGLRALAVLLLVLLVARPVVRHWGGLFGSGTGRDVVMLVDSSASMNARTAGVPAMERAKAAALAVARRLGKDDRLTLIRVAARPEEVFSRFGIDAAAVREKIEGLQAGPSRANLFAALTLAFDPKARRAAPTVYLFTDGQVGGWREVRDQGLAKVIPEKAKLFVVDVGSKDAIPNRGVIGDVPRPSQAIVGLPVTLRPRVVNHSKGEAAEVAVGVILDEKEVARASMSLKPGETASKEVMYVPSEPGVVKGRYEIAADRFPDDDSYLFTLSVAPPVKVLLVNGNPASDPFENEGLYLRTALTANPEGDGPAIAKAAGRDTLKALDLQEIPEAGLNPELLRDASVDDPRQLRHAQRPAFRLAPRVRLGRRRPDRLPRRQGEPRHLQQELLQRPRPRPAPVRRRDARPPRGRTRQARDLRTPRDDRLRPPDPQRLRQPRRPLPDRRPHLPAVRHDPARRRQKSGKGARRRDLAAGEVRQGDARPGRVAVRRRPASWSRPSRPTRSGRTCP